ncbi:MAG: tRNA lysidine(34) synthetase TilS [Oligoflexales bacterium]
MFPLGTCKNTIVSLVNFLNFLFGYLKVCAENEKNHMLEYFGSDLISLAEEMDSCLERFCQQYKGVMVACSGGADSTALFHMLFALTKQKKNFPLAISHTNFGLRGNESDEDQKFLENLAKNKRVKIIIHEAPKKNEDDKNTGSVQQWARKVRYQEFEKLSQEGWIIALAHHQDDIAENILLRMARGTSAGSMAGMQDWNPPFWRPLLPVTKAILKTWLDRHQLLHREDSSNDKMDYSRNVIRHKVLPLLDQMFPGAKRRIARCGLDAWDLGRFCIETVSPQVAAARSAEGVPLSWFLDNGRGISVQALSAIIGPLKKNRNGLSHQLLGKIWDLIEVSAKTKQTGKVTLPADGGVVELKNGRLRVKDCHKISHLKRVMQHESSHQAFESLAVLGPKASVSTHLSRCDHQDGKNRILVIKNQSNLVMPVKLMIPRARQMLQFAGSAKVWAFKELMLKNNIPVEAKRDMFICTEFLPKEAKTNMVSLGIFWKGDLLRPDLKGCLKCVKENIAMQAFEH